jgi:hypothetical protein
MSNNVLTMPPGYSVEAAVRWLHSSVYSGLCLWIGENGGPKGGYSCGRRDLLCLSVASKVSFLGIVLSGH